MTFAAKPHNPPLCLHVADVHAAEGHVSAASLVLCGYKMSFGDGVAVQRALFEIRHSVEGEVRFVRSNDSLCIRVHWPFDMSTDEWIEMTLQVPFSDVHAALSDVLDRGSARTVESASRDALTIRPVGLGVEFDFTAGAVRPPKRYIAVVQRDEAMGLRAACSESARG